MGRFDLLPDPETLAAGQALFDKSFEELTNRWIAVWCGYLGIDSVFIVIFVFAMWAQHRDLRQAITSAKVGTTSWDTQSSQHMANLVWSFRSLQITGVTVVLILFSFMGLQIPLINRTTTVKALHGETISTILKLLAL